jgi:thiamine-phosphate pyrophosphorylase
VPERRSLPRLIAVSDRASLAVTWEDWLAALAEAAVDGLQVREKALADREVHALAARARTALPAACLTVNGRADLALAAGADGAHLPADGVPLARLRERFGEALVLGKSTHRVVEVEAARDAGADYVTFGPVFATPSKAAFGEPVGIAALRDAVAVGIPVYALGGVTEQRLEEVAAAGAAGAAGIRMFADPARLPAVAALARRVFPAASESA